MTPNPTWHADPESLRAYATGALSRAGGASVEAHLTTCAPCRAGLDGLVAPSRLDRGLVELLDCVDRPRVGPVERVLQRLRVPEHLARVLTVTPTARAAWLTGVAAALSTAVAAEALAAPGRMAFLFLVLAPLLPLVGVTAAFGVRGDPARELLVVTPMHGFELSMLRSMAVLVPTIAVASAAALLVPGRGWEPVLWLLPSSGLVAVTLAAGTWLPIRPVAWTLGSLWLVGAVLSARGTPSTALVDEYVAFRPAGQAALLALTIAAALAVDRRRDTFDIADAWRMP
jgi:hypothetical protein